LQRARALASTNSSSSSSSSSSAGLDTALLVLLHPALRCHPQNTIKITEAMKLVAAAKVRRAQEAVVNGRPFAENLIKVRHSKRPS
jgi:hypothetical protein